MSVNSSTYLLPEKTLTTGFSAVVDGQRMTMPTWNTKVSATASSVCVGTVVHRSPAALKRFLISPGGGV
jgi:hypothetical protein